MVLPHHIEEAERIGMPRDKIGLVLQFCRQCDKKLTDNPDKCDECGRETCPKCWYYIPDIGLKFCGKECAITKLLKLLAAAEMNDKPITEHPDVQRLIGQVVELQAENKAKEKALLEYGNHRPSCNRYTVPSSCTCGWNFVKDTLKGQTND